MVGPKIHIKYLVSNEKRLINYELNNVLAFGGICSYMRVTRLICYTSFTKPLGMVTLSIWGAPDIEKLSGKQIDWIKCAKLSWRLSLELLLASGNSPTPSQPQNLLKFFFIAAFWSTQTSMPPLGSTKNKNLTFFLRLIFLSF